MSNTEIRTRAPSFIKLKLIQSVVRVSCLSHNTRNLCVKFNSQGSGSQCRESQVLGSRVPMSWVTESRFSDSDFRLRPNYRNNLTYQNLQR